jgi:hypothetical protein
VAVFISKLTEDEAKRRWLESRHDITDVLNLTSEAKSRYDGKGDSKAFKWLSKFSYRIQYYGTIMDTVWNPLTSSIIPRLNYRWIDVAAPP